MLGSYEERWFSPGALRQELSGNTATYNVSIYPVGIDQAKVMLAALMPFWSLMTVEIVVDTSGLTGPRVPLSIEPGDLHSILVKKKLPRWWSRDAGDQGP
jgi:hypothetical protein